MDRIRALELGIRRAEYEIDFWKRRFMELETHFLRIKQVELQKFELQKALEVSIANYYQLSSVFEDKKKECDEIQSKLDDLILRKIDVQNELKDYKRTSTELQEQVMRLEEDRKVVYESEKKAQERIVYLEEEIKKMESSERDKYVELEKENRELETQEASWLDHVVELEIELDSYKTKCSGLSLELREKKMASVEIEDKLKDLMLRKIAVDDELKECKTICNGQKEQIMVLEEDRNILRGREKRAEEKITCLSEELKKRESDESSKFAQLNMEIKNLETGKRNAEHEVDVWKKRFSELDAQAAVKMKHQVELEKELGVYKSKCHRLYVDLEEKKRAGIASEDKLKHLVISVGDELKECRTMYNGQKEQIMVLEKENSIFREKEKMDQELITCLSKELKKRDCEDSEKSAQLKMEIKNLESWKRRAENGVEVWKKKFRELEAQVLRLKQVELKKSELEKELEAYKIQCHGLCAELEQKKKECVAVEGKLKDLQLRKKVVDDELEEYKTKSNEMKELTMGLEVDLKVICEKENLAQERIGYLEEEIEKMERYVREKYVELTTENKDLECGKRRAEGEIEMWNKKFRELETQFLSLEVENATLRCISSTSQVCGNIKLETGGLENEISNNDKQKTCKNKRLLSETDSATDGAFASCNDPSSRQGNRHVHFAGPPSINLQSEPLMNAMEGKDNNLLESKVDFGSRDRKELIFESDRSANEKIVQLKKGSVRTAFGGFIELSDNEDKNKISPEHICKIRDKQMVHVPTNCSSQRSLANETDLAFKKCLKRPCADRRGAGYRSSYEDDTTLSSTSKLRPSKSIATENEIDNDDRIPVGKVKVEKPELN